MRSSKVGNHVKSFCCLCIKASWQTAVSYAISFTALKERTDNNPHGIREFEFRFGNFITELESKIGYAFIDRTLAAESLNHGGRHESWYLLDGQRKSIPRNDRLSLHGNAALYYLLAQDWYTGDWDKGTATCVSRVEFGVCRSATN